MAPKWNPRDADVSRFTEGDCHIFARALNKATGWPIHTSDGHAYVTRPDGMRVDVQGVHQPSTFRRTWGPDLGPIAWSVLRGDWGGPSWGDYSYSRAKQVAAEMLAVI